MDGDGNAGCDPLEELTPGQSTNVKISIGAGGVDVLVKHATDSQAVVVCSRIATTRRPWPHVHVFSGDPWHAPALASLTSLIVRPLQPKPVRTQTP